MVSCHWHFDRNVSAIHFLSDINAFQLQLHFLNGYVNSLPQLFWICQAIGAKRNTLSKENGSVRIGWKEI